MKSNSPLTRKIGLSRTASPLSHCAKRAPPNASANFVVNATVADIASAGIKRSGVSAVPNSACEPAAINGMSGG